MRRLTKWLSERGHAVHECSYPVYRSFFGKELGTLLSGSSKDFCASSLDPKSMALWYALDRWLDYNNHLAAFGKNDFVLLNRYTLSSQVYQSLRSDTNNNLAAWVDELEHSVLGLPRPDLYIIFDVDPSVAMQNVLRKGSREYIADEADMYERDKTLQSQARQLYLSFGRSNPNTKIICCSTDREMVSEQVIFDRLISTLRDSEML